MGISSLSLVCPCMICSKRKKKNMQRKSKAKRIKILLNMVASVFLGDVGVIGYTSKVIVPIKQFWLCVSVFDFLISQIIIIWDTYALLLCFSHTTRKNSLILLIHVQVQCDLTITRNKCVNVCVSMESYWAIEGYWELLSFNELTLLTWFLDRLAWL